MRRTTWGVLLVAVVLVAGGGLVAVMADDLWVQFQSTDPANDLTVENERSERVTVDITVREEGSTVATANATIGPGERTEFEDLAPYGTYRLVATQGNRTLRTGWAAEGCVSTTVEVTDAGLDTSTIVC